MRTDCQERTSILCVHLLPICYDFFNKEFHIMRSIIAHITSAPTYGTAVRLHQSTVLSVRHGSVCVLFFLVEGQLPALLVIRPCVGCYQAHFVTSTLGLEEST